MRCNSEVTSRRAKLASAFLLTALLVFAGGPGFRSQAQLDEHYAKHGAEFGHISEAEYLRLAQELRDAPAGGPILEARRPNGQFSRRRIAADGEGCGSGVATFRASDPAQVG